MSTRNRPSRPQRSVTSQSNRRSTGTGATSVPEAGRRAAPKRARAASLPVESHRAAASLALVLMMLFALLSPLSQSPADAAPFMTPRIDGRGSIPQAGFGAEESIFSYVPFLQRSEASMSGSWPSAVAALRLDADDVRVRRAIAGHVYASTSGNLDIRLRASGIEISPTAQQLEDYEQAYGEMLSDSTRGPRGVNGLASILLIRSLNAEGAERRELETLAIDGFRQAIGEETNTWQFTHNWALANMVAGNYAQAYEGMRLVTGRAAQENNLLASFWTGLAALRMGDPGEAVQQFTRLSRIETPPGGNEAFNDLYEELRDLSREGLGDAQRANRDPAGAYRTYFESLLLGGSDAALYGKWVQLGLEQRAYEKLLDDMGTLQSASEFRTDSRVYHDRGRLLDLLGRQGEAEGQYREALRLGENDAGLLVAYGQSLESRGDHEGAIAQAYDAIVRLGKDPQSPDLSSVARAATTANISLADEAVAQQLLDAEILRARAWGRQGNTAAVDSLAQQIVQRAEGLTPEQVGLLHLYAAFAYEAAGNIRGALNSYTTARSALSATPGTPGRAAAIAGAARTSSGGPVGDMTPLPPIQVLQFSGYDVTNPPATIATDPDAPEILLQGALFLQQEGRLPEAANAFRLASITTNLRDVRSLSGVGRPIWSYNGSPAPAGLALQAADALRRAEAADRGLLAERYKQAFGLSPALAPAWNNLGVYYARNDNADLGRFYLRSAAIVSPSYAWGQQNLASLGYKQGPSGFFTAEGAQGDVIKAVGPQALSWGHDLRYDTRGSAPAPALPPSDFLSKLPALLLLGLLLLHTIIGDDRLTNRMGVLPARSILGKLGMEVDTRAKDVAPALITPRSDLRSLLVTIAIPSVIGMIALAWGTSGASLEVFLLFLPVALLASLVAFGGNEFAQRQAARQQQSYTLHHNWPLGIILGILSIPFGFLYGWQTVTRVQAAAGDGLAPGRSRNTRTTEERELLEEARIEAAADVVSADVIPRMPGMPSRRWIGGNPGLTIMLAGLGLNLLAVLIAGLVYWLTGWPSARIIAFASVLVLAFTSVSDPPADGWTLYRRNPALWLALFVLASVVAALLALRVI